MVQKGRHQRLCFGKRLVFGIAALLQRQTRGEQGPLVDTKHICSYCMALWPVLNEINVGYRLVWGYRIVSTDLKIIL